MCRSQHFNSVNKRENNWNSHWRTSARLKYVIASSLPDCCTSVLNILWVRQYQTFTSQIYNIVSVYPFKANAYGYTYVYRFEITCRESNICWVNYRRVCELMSARIFPLVSASGISLRGASSPVREWVYCSPTSAATSLLHQGTLLFAGFTDRGEDSL